MNKGPRICILVFSISLFSLCAPAQEIDYKGFPEWSWHREDSTEYMLYTPAHLEPGKKYPVALALHGCCGTSYHASLRNAVDPIVRMWHQFGENRQAVPTYIIAPATSRGWRQHFGNLKKVMDELIASGRADPQRIYISGFSMGGEGTFEMIQQYPGFFAAAITMGMRFRGDSNKVKDIPIWANQGETDWFSRSLRRDVAAIRHANGDAADTGAVWITGVNPRYSNFKGVDHGVMWDAASKQDLTGWAYSKTNDGNIYPVVFFRSPQYREQVEAGRPVPVEVEARDADGHITRLEVWLNGKKQETLLQEPFRFSINPVRGDNIIRVLAYDNGGKSSEASLTVEVPVNPEFLTARLDTARAGAWYETRLIAQGNGDLRFQAAGDGKLPAGLCLYPDGSLSGIPEKAGRYTLQVKLTDGNGKTALKGFSLQVRAKSPDAVIVTDLLTRTGKRYRTGSMRPGAAPFFNGKDSALRNDRQEIHFDDPGVYAGLTYIQTDEQDADETGADFLRFRLDEDAIVYIAYEKLDYLFHSAFPAWLQDYKKEEGELVAQYRYFAIFSKPFARGMVSLPAAGAKANGVASNYFIMIKKK
jgi:dienelactone hydrolase